MEAGEGWWEGATENPLFVPRKTEVISMEVNDSESTENKMINPLHAIGKAEDTLKEEEETEENNIMKEETFTDKVVKSYYKYWCCWKSSSTVNKVVRKAKRRKSEIRKTVEKYEEEHPTLMKILDWGKSFVGIGLYFSDITTDILLCITFYKFRHYGWFSLMMTFIGLPYLLAQAGMMYYCWKDGAGLLIPLLFPLWLFPSSDL